MDLSIVAAVGSFVVSERVLKPKATALFILGCLLAYDLTTKTHDSASLRVYRGKLYPPESITMGSPGDHCKINTHFSPQLIFISSL